MEGQAAISFVPGQKVALSPAEFEETQDERRTRVTDRDLVWPGRTETLQIVNPEAMAYRYDLTVTDLPPTLYMRRPPLGGAWQPQGGVLLQPGEEATFEVVFVPPAATDKMRTRTFSFVLTRFDPRRSADDGEIVQDLPLRWVTLPASGDLEIRASPTEVIIRPWRRAALFRVQMQNRSFLPPSVDLQIVRGTTKEALAKEPETVGTLSQSVPARTPGVWHCLLPAAPQRSSYLATVMGEARVAENTTHPLALPRPVLVRYVPWLRLGRDWAFLVGALLLLVWLVWGIPVQKRPIVRVSLAFAGLPTGQLPDESSLQDVKSQLVLLNDDDHPEEGAAPLLGVPKAGALEFELPPRWYGNRWPLGWNKSSLKPQHIQITLAPADGADGLFKKFSLSKAAPAEEAQPFPVASASAPWASALTLAIPHERGVIVQVRLGSLGALAGKDVRQIELSYDLNGKTTTQTEPVWKDHTGKFAPITLDLTDQVGPGEHPDFRVGGKLLGTVQSNEMDYEEVKRQDAPFPVTLTFPDTIPLTPDQIARRMSADKAAADKAAAVKAAADKAAADKAAAKAADKGTPKDTKTAADKTAADKTAGAKAAEAKAAKEKATQAARAARDSAAQAAAQKSAQEEAAHATAKNAQEEAAAAARAAHSPTSAYNYALRDDRQNGEQVATSAPLDIAVKAYLLADSDDIAGAQAALGQVSDNPDPAVKAMVLVARGVIEAKTNRAAGESDLKQAQVQNPANLLAYVAYADVRKDDAASNALTDAVNDLKSAENQAHTRTEKADINYHLAKLYLDKVSPDFARPFFKKSSQDPYLKQSQEYRNVAAQVPH